MTRLTNCLILVLFPIIFPINANAQQYGHGGWIFGGLGVGTTIVRSDEKNPADNPVNPGQNELNKSGYGGHVKAGLSYYLSNSFVGDADLGFDYSKVTGTAGANRRDVSIEHRVGVFSLSPRYRFGDTGVWQLGPLYKMTFGTDTNYSEREGQYSGEKPITHYLGLHLNLDLPSESEKTIYRIGAEALTDISDPRSIYKFNLLFEIGFNLWGADNNRAGYTRPAREEREEREEPAMSQDLMPDEGGEPPLPPDDVALPPAAAEDVTAYVNKDVMMLRFPGDRFRFATGMSHIGSKNTREYLKELGAFLAANGGVWRSAVIAGHTDRRGPPGRAQEVNQELSDARAKTVNDILVASGVPQSKLKYEGRAFSQPVRGTKDNAAGWKKNRRVELTFNGVRAPKVIQRKIAELNQKYKAE